MVWETAGISNLRCRVAADHAGPVFSAAATGGSASTISPFLGKWELGVWPIPQGNVESHSLGGHLSFPGISGKYLGRAV